VTTWQSRWSQAWLLRQMIYRRVMLACSLRVGWPVPSSAKYRRAVNCASTRFNQDESVGVQAVSTLPAVAHSPALRSLAVVRWGEKLPQMIAIRTSGGRASAGSGRTPGTGPGSCAA
jgi:hypothetical protein